jgi:integrase/recombinase XerD
MFKFSSQLWFNKRRILKDGQASIYIQATINREQNEFPLKLKWPVDKIDTPNFKLLPRAKKDPEVIDYNLLIDCERAKITDILLTYRLRREEITIKQLTREMKVYDSKECFISYFRREADRRYLKREISLKTYQNAKAVLAQVIQYDNLSLFKNINLQWMRDFRLYLQNKEFKPGHFYKPGTVWDRLKTTLSYLQLANVEPMISVHKDVFDFTYSTPPEVTTYLDREELRRLIMLQEYDLTDRELRVLKAFLFCCFTSIRISDLYQVNYRWEIQKNFLDFIPQKNRNKGRMIRIPFLPIARTFISSQNNLTFFDLPNSVQYNETLKVIAGKAQIKKVLTSHVGRHTFGYLFMTSVGDIAGLQKILGHAKMDTTQRYAHIDDEYKYESAKKIQAGFGDIALKIVS